MNTTLFFINSKNIKFLTINNIKNNIDNYNLFKIFNKIINEEVNYDLKINVNNISFVEKISRNLISFLSKNYKINLIRNNLIIIKKNYFNSEKIYINIDRFAEKDSDTLIYKFIIYKNNKKNLIEIIYLKSNIISKFKKLSK